MDNGITIIVIPIIIFCVAIIHSVVLVEVASRGGGRGSGAGVIIGCPSEQEEEKNGSRTDTHTLLHLKYNPCRSHE